MDVLPHDVQRLIVSKVARPCNLRASCRRMRWLMDGCNTFLSLPNMTDALAPSTQEVLGLVQRMPILSSLMICRLWPTVQWASVLAACPGLSTLDLTICLLMTDLSVLAECPGLRTLVISFSPLVTDISALATCTGLRTLDLTGCRQVADLSALATCTVLRTLDLTNCRQVADLSALAACVGMQHTLGHRRFGNTEM